MALRVRRLEAGGDLGQARVAGDERSDPPAAASAATMPNASGKIDGDGHVGERHEVDEVPVLERAGEERSRRRRALELGAIVAEADDDRAAGVRRSASKRTWTPLL